MVVTVPGPTAIADAYGVIKVISRENSSAKVYVAVNMVENQEEGEQVYERLMLVAEKFLNFPPEPLGFIVKDPTVAKAVSSSSLLPDASGIEGFAQHFKDCLRKYWPYRNSPWRIIIILAKTFFTTAWQLLMLVKIKFRR